jgi:hypothetical protein
VTMAVWGGEERPALVPVMEKVASRRTSPISIATWRGCVSVGTNYGTHTRGRRERGRERERKACPHRTSVCG